jgi:peptidoglycan-associated lipoprotein
MRGTKLFAGLLAALLVLSACSSVKLDESAPLEDRGGKTSASAKANSGSSTGSAPGANANASKNAGKNGSESDLANSSANAANGSANAANGSANAANGSANAANLKKGDRVNDSPNDPGSVLANRSIYFDLDSFVVKHEFKSVIDAHSQYLIAHPDRKVIIQGNTDERGGSEYNLALGQKRAEAVRRALSLLGVPDGQMEAVSFGKEKPKATGRDESAWAQNRRADIAY